MAKDLKEIDLVPPAEVAREAKRGLALREAHGRGGTEVGVRRAHQLKDRRALTRDDVVAMASYFARHRVDKRGRDWDNAEKPSAGRIAWLLWGGEPGRDWAERKKVELENAKPEKAGG